MHVPPTLRNAFQQARTPDQVEAVITEIRRVSTSGRRSYAGAAKLQPIMRGFGISILTTSKGVVSDREARKQKLGGEVLCIVK